MRRKDAIRRLRVFLAAAAVLTAGCAAVCPAGEEAEAVPETETETEFKLPEMVIGSFDGVGDQGQEEEEIDWAAFAPELDENGEFFLDEAYILSYESDVCSDMIFYGDSRVVGMAYTTGGYHYVGKESEGLTWMKGDGLDYLEDQMEQWPQADIVFCFGVNDPDNIDKYISFYRDYTETWPDRRFWFLSVNPVYDGIGKANGYYAKNSKIEDFNEKLREAFPDRYIDTYSYLKEYGYNAQDGVHYDGITYSAVQDYCWRAITQKLEEEDQ